MLGKYCIAACFGVVAAGAVNQSLKADLLAHEPFPLPSTQLAGMNTGTGFAGPWLPGGFNASTWANYAVYPDGLTFGPLQTSGGRGFAAFTTNTISGLTRPLAQPIGETGTTRYLSFLLRPEGAINQGVFNGFFGLTLEAAAEPQIFTGKPGSDAIGDYVIENRGGEGQFSTFVPAAVGVTSLLVIKAEFGQPVDRFTLYMNPIPGGPEPLVGTVKQDVDVAMIPALTLYSTGAYSIDEIRVGNTFADVTPVPEPSVGALLLLGAGVLCRRRWLRH